LRFAERQKIANAVPRFGWNYKPGSDVGTVIECTLLL
jgi:hypothetical protein